jgi:hypothetical protein
MKKLLMTVPLGIAGLATAAVVATQAPAAFAHGGDDTSSVSRVADDRGRDHAEDGRHHHGHGRDDHGRDDRERDDRERDDRGRDHAEDGRHHHGHHHGHHGGDDHGHHGSDD